MWMCLQYRTMLIIISHLIHTYLFRWIIAIYFICIVILSLVKLENCSENVWALKNGWKEKWKDVLHWS